MLEGKETECSIRQKDRRWKDLVRKGGTAAWEKEAKGEVHVER